MMTTVIRTSQDSSPPQSAPLNAVPPVPIAEFTMLGAIVLAVSSFALRRHYRQASLRRRTATLEKLWQLDSVNTHDKQSSN